MIQTTRISEILKQEVLDAISKSNFEFEQSCEGDCQMTDAEKKLKLKILTS